MKGQNECATTETNSAADTLPELTPELRKNILSKDYLDIRDVQLLLGYVYGEAAKLIRQIKRKYDRLHVRGKIHIQDYLDYFTLPADRYVVADEERAEQI